MSGVPPFAKIARVLTQMGLQDEVLEALVSMMAILTSTS